METPFNTIRDTREVPMDILWERYTQLSNAAKQMPNEKNIKRNLLKLELEIARRKQAK